MSYVAFQYAEALFSLALEEKKTDLILSAFDDFIKAKDQDISLFLNHPKITKTQKKEVLDNAISEPLFKNFVFVLIDRSRMEFLEDCFEEYKKLYDAQNKLLKVHVYSGKTLQKAEVEKLQANLEKKHNRNVQIENIVDEKIVGGLRIEFEGKVLDDTINNYLATLKHNLTK